MLPLELPLELPLGSIFQEGGHRFFRGVFGTDILCRNLNTRNRKTQLLLILTASTNNAHSRIKFTTNLATIKQGKELEKDISRYLLLLVISYS